MIERLLDGERQLGGEESRRAIGDILAASDALAGCLDEAGKQWLEKLGDAYGRRQRSVMEAAFREGFCQAVLLALDVLAYQADLPED